MVAAIAVGSAAVKDVVVAVIDAASAVVAISVVVAGLSSGVAVDVVAELAEMCSGKATLRTNDKEITVFKAIGQAVTDLVAASMAYSALE